MTDHVAVKQFWDEQAREHGVAGVATAPDHHYRELEISRISETIRSCVSAPSRIVDFGCGNGFSTARFSREFPEHSFLGVDYSEQMIAEALRLRALSNLKNIDFSVANVLSPGANDTLKPKLFDVVACTRVLINLADWSEQKAAIANLKTLLADDGALILAENTEDGLKNLNDLRQQFDLPAIKQRWHNKYLPGAELEAFLNKEFVIEKAENIGNLYYILSRVVYAKLASMEGVEPQYEHPINEIASRLPSLPLYNYSPNMLWVLRKR
jgi:SAM-dependent methyltransferase